jgi:formate dehydrogenase subunit gamma
MNDSHILPNGRIVRYSFGERLVHWLASVTYVYLLLTGLAFWSPWLFWIAIMLGGGNGTISRELHPWVGVLFTIATVLMYRAWASQMKRTPADKEWLDSVSHYIRNEDEAVPPADRFNAGQKLLFWGFFWCSIVLLLTGLVLWLPHWIPWNLRFLRSISVILHPIAALVTIALFMIHLYMGVAIEEGALHSIVRGDVSQRWAREFHRLWYEKVLRQSLARK